MEDKLKEVFDATTEAILNRLHADDMGGGDIKVATDFLKLMKYESVIIPGSQIEEVKKELEFPKFKQG